MNEELIQNLSKALKGFSDRRVVSQEELQSVITAIVAVLAANKKAVESLNEETKTQLKEVLDYVDNEHSQIIASIKGDFTKTKQDIERATKEQTDRAFRRLQEVIAKIKIPKDGQRGEDGQKGEDGKDGVDGSPDTPAQVRDKLETLKDDDRLDASAIKNLPEFVESKANGGGWRNLYQMHDVLISEPTNAQVLKYNSTTSLWENGTGGGGSGDITKVGTPVNNQIGVWTGDGTLEGDVDLTWDTATNTLGVGLVGLDARVQVHAIKSDASDGLLIEANNGTDVGLLGAGNTANVTWYGSHNFDTATQDTIAAFIGAGKTLGSLAVATYPSLTELTYLKGVTSAIQTQLNAKQASDTQLTSLAGLTYAGNGGKFIRLNAGETDFEFAAIAGSGTVTSVSVVSANGFAGTVATDTTTPAITLTTSITGVLKGNGTAISAATAGTDYAVGSAGLAGGQTIAGSTLTLENLTLRANAADLTTGAVIVSSSKEATNTTTGSVQLAGGLAVAKRVYALDMTVTNTITGSISGNAGTASAVAVGGITGLGTNVATALAVAVGSAGAFVTLNGALGTPSSGTVTNLTGTASININGTVGATTPTTGVFTTLVAGSATSLLLGTAGSAVGSVGFRNATSGTITISPTTGALGTIAIVVPANAGTIAVSATSTTTTQAMFATATAGAPAFRAIAAGDLPGTLSSGTAITNAALTTPTLGTPASGTLTNCTGYEFNDLVAPSGASAITFAAGRETTWTYSATTQTGILKTSTTLTTGMIQKNSVTGSSAVASAASSGSLLTLTSSTTGFTAATQRLGAIYSTGANSNASVVLQGLDISVANTGTTNTNQALRLSASGGSTTNIALDIAAGELRLAGSAGTSGQILISGGANANPSWTSSPTVSTLTVNTGITLAENASIALDPAGSADGKYSGITVTGTGGATIAFGDLVTLDKDDSRWELVDISVAAAATGDARGIIGIAVTSSTDGGALTVLLNGIIRADANFPALTIGAAVYASTTGDIVVTQPTTTDHVIRVVGFALTADEIYFNPSQDYITHT